MEKDARTVPLRLAGVKKINMEITGKSPGEIRKWIGSEGEYFILETPQWWRTSPAVSDLHIREYLQKKAEFDGLPEGEQQRLRNEILGGGPKGLFGKWQNEFKPVVVQDYLRTLFNAKG